MDIRKLRWITFEERLFKLQCKNYKHKFVLHGLRKTSFKSLTSFVLFSGCRDISLGAGGSHMELHASGSHNRKIP